MSQTLQEIVEVIIDKDQWVGGPVDDADGLDVAVFRPTEPVAGLTLARITVGLDLDEGEALVVYTIHDDTTICAAPLKSAAAMRWLAGRVAALRAHGALGIGVESRLNRHDRQNQSGVHFELAAHLKGL